MVVSGSRPPSSIVCGLVLVILVVLYITLDCLLLGITLRIRYPIFYLQYAITYLPITHTAISITVD